LIDKFTDKKHGGLDKKFYKKDMITKNLAHYIKDILDLQDDIGGFHSRYRYALLAAFLGALILALDSINHFLELISIPKNYLQILQIGFVFLLIVLFVNIYDVIQDAVYMKKFLKE